MVSALRSFALVWLVVLIGCSKDPPEKQITFVVELDPSVAVKSGDEVRVVERFVTAYKTYLIYEARTFDALVKALDQQGVSAKKIVQVRDTNSPTRGGGRAAEKQPREGHKVYVIERTVPGVGSFPEEKKQTISKKSNAAAAEIGANIEWDHSYLTDEGTYCVYRATDEDTIRKHAQLAGARVDKVSEVKSTQ